MLIIPAVDIRGGRAVRLMEGDYGRETVFYDDPVEAAVRWRDEGAEYLHVVDLDGAREGTPVNSAFVEKIVRSTGIPVEAGGGIRRMKTVEMYIDCGVDMIILGTAACAPGGILEEAVDKYGASVAVSLDVRGGRPSVRGWTESAGRSVSDLLCRFEKSGVQNLVFTDICRDGLLGGVDVPRVKETVSSTTIRTTVAGGVGSLNDIINLSELDIRGVIVGRALYSGNVDLREAMACLRR